MAGKSGAGKQTAKSKKRSKRTIKYTDDGYVRAPRKWMGRELAAVPYAFTLYVHLVSWANHKDGKLRRGQLALGERDFGLLLGGWSVVTIRKWLRWLRDNGWILLEPKTWGQNRGTIITIIHYEASQSFHTYKYTSEFQERLLTPQSEDQNLILGQGTNEHISEPEDQNLILGECIEDQELILKRPFEDQNLIPQGSIRKTNTYPHDAKHHESNGNVNKKKRDDDASRQRCPDGQNYRELPEEGVRLPADDITKPGLAELRAKWEKEDREKKVGREGTCNFRA